MKGRKTNQEREYKAALAYYEQTIRKHVGDLPLAAAQYAVARRAWERLDKAQRAWVDTLDVSGWAQAGGTERHVRSLAPRRLENDDTIAPELLATIACARLGTPKPKSMRNAAEDAHQVLMACRDYLRALPEARTKAALMLGSYLDTVSFTDILGTSGKPDSLPLLPTVQPKRNNGALTDRALEQALKRHANSAPKKIQQQIREALKTKAISCRLLEEIRWSRFLRHFKPR
jgi:hypothetical protein